MAKYVLSRRAEQDVQNIADYGFANFGSAKARGYGHGLEKCFGHLAESPAIGLAADDLAAGIRRYKYESHWVFYLEENRGILVVRVLQKNMDFVRHL